MAMPELTGCQKNLSHILAYWFTDHDRYHHWYFKKQGYCPYCDALRDLEAYVDAKQSPS